MAFTCEKCNITFDTASLYDTHKRKFCVDSKNGDPGRRGSSSQNSNKGEEHKNKDEKRPNQTPLPGLTSAIHSRPSPEFFMTKVAGQNLNHFRHFSAPNTPIGKHDEISALEKEKIDELRRFKAHQSVHRSTKNFEDKHLVRTINNSQLQTPQKSKDDISRSDRYDDKIWQLTEIHRQQLAELKLRNERLQEERAMIAEKMNSLGLKSRQRVPSQGSVEKQATELDGLKRYLDFKEEEEKRNSEVQHSKVDMLRGDRWSPPQSVSSYRSNASRSQELKQLRRSPRKLDGDSRTQLIPYNPSPLRYVDPTLSNPSQNNVLHELNMLKNDYFHRGGHDPRVLSQIRELEMEAQRIQPTQRPAAVDPFLQQQIMAFHMANQRLEQELHLLREERNQKERMRSPDMDPELKRVKEEHLVRMASLRQEAEFLKQQAEVEKVRKELKELRGEQSPLQEHHKVNESPFIISNSSTERELLPSPYDPNAGFAVLWDFILGLSSSLSKCRLAAGVYQGSEIVTDVKLLPLIKTTYITKESHPTIPSGGVGIIGVKHAFPRCIPDQTLSLVVELQANSAEDFDDPNKLFSKGWTKIDLFDMSNRLISGRWKIPIRITPIRVFLNTYELNKIPQVGQAEVYLRLVNSRDVPSQESLNPQPLQHYLYKYPSVENIGVMPHVQPLRRSPVSRGLTDYPPAPPPSVPPPPDTPASVIQKVESTPPTPADDSMIGLQVDKLTDVIEGVAKIKITVYDHEDGQVLKGENNTPVMCVTKSATQDFLEGIYSFGLQEAQFKNVPWDFKSVIVFRLYLQPGDVSSSGNSTAPAANLLDESKLAAWAALPLTVMVGSRASRRSRQSQGAQQDNAELNVGTHNLPLFFPPVAPIPNIPLRGPFPDQWSRYGEATLRISIFTPLSSPPERPSSPEEFLQENDLPENSWIKNGRASILTEEFQDGNGFDLYIDGARFLPDSVTISKVAGRVLDKNYTRIGGDIDVQAELESDIYNPSYNLRLEFREPGFPPSATLMLKLYTVDSLSRLLCCAGYGFLPIFLEVGTTKQPSVSGTEVKVALNEGPHQIRLYGSSPDLTQPLHETVTQTLPRVPCASLLVRVVHAATHPNGQPKEASQFKEHEWEAEGLFQQKPNYSDGVYYSLTCEPTPGECQILHSMVKRQPIRTRDAIRLIGDGTEQKLKKNSVIESWIKTQLTRNMDSLPGDLDLAYVVIYHVTHGLQISLDAAQNLPWNNFTVASYCLSPPGSFYRGKGDDPLNFVTRPLYSSTVSSPSWREGFKAFPRRWYHKHMVLIVHLHELVIDVSQTKTTYSLQGQAWSAVQIFDEGYVMNGCYQLPLFSGEPPEIVLNSLQTDNCADVLASFRRKKVIKYLEGSSVYVRFSDARRVEELPSPKTKSIQIYIPSERLDKYLNVNASPTLSSLVPRGVSQDELTEELTSGFKVLLNQVLESHQKNGS